MLLEVGQFCEKVETGISSLVRDLQSTTGRYGEAEKAAWTASLKRVATLLGKPQLEAFRGYHLHVGQRGAGVGHAGSWMGAGGRGRGNPHRTGPAVAGPAVTSGARAHRSTLDRAGG